MIPIETRKAQLEARLRELDSRLHRIETELDQPTTGGSADLAIERESEEVLEDLGAASVQEMRKINAALDRIAQGQYGICVTCGDPISGERLDVLPHTPKCRNCAT